MSWVVLWLAVACLVWPPPIRLDLESQCRGGLARTTAAPSPGRRVGSRLGVGQRAGSREVRSSSDIADLLGLIAAPLRAGAAPALAVVAGVRAAGGLHPSLHGLVEDLHRQAAAGAGLAAVWLEHAAALRSADLEFVGQAWLLTEHTGAPLAPALHEAERVIRARSRARRRLGALSAGPRASMVVLSCLPLSGPVVGAVFGLAPGDLYLASPITLASAALGVAMTGLGWWWGRRILTGALDP